MADGQKAKLDWHAADNGSISDKDKHSTAVYNNYNLRSKSKNVGGTEAGNETEKSKLNKEDLNEEDSASASGAQTKDAQVPGSKTQLKLKLQLKTNSNEFYTSDEDDVLDESKRSSRGTIPPPPGDELTSEHDKKENQVNPDVEQRSSSSDTSSIAKAETLMKHFDSSYASARGTPETKSDSESKEKNEARGEKEKIKKQSSKVDNAEDNLLSGQTPSDSTPVSPANEGSTNVHLTLTSQKRDSTSGSDNSNPIQQSSRTSVKISDVSSKVSTTSNDVGVSSEPNKDPPRSTNCKSTRPVTPSPVHTPQSPSVLSTSSPIGSGFVYIQSMPSTHNNMEMVNQSVQGGPTRPTFGTTITNPHPYRETSIDASGISPQLAYVTPDLHATVSNRPRDHSILFYPKYDQGGHPLQRTRVVTNFDEDFKWSDPNFVQLPISSKYKGWDRIVKALDELKLECRSGKFNERPTRIGRRIQAAIDAFRFDAFTQSDFAILAEKHIALHIVNTVPHIVDHALMLPHLLAKPIPILKGENKTIYLTKQLCASLLANAFFCTFPEPRPMNKLPNYNFFRLFNSTSEVKTKVKMEKLMCILNYFYQMSPDILRGKGMENVLQQVVSYEKRQRNRTFGLSQSRKPLIETVVEPKKHIEEMVGFLQVDFANKLIGGGVLGDGAVMEEIRFSVCPELIVARLFTECMQDDEVLFITGTQQFSKYKGYGSSFEFVEPLTQKLATDTKNRLVTQVVAIDALQFKQHEKSSQFHESLVNREIHKCFVGFTHGGRNISPIATGNWGCGAFNGDTELKFLIQLISASENGRPAMHYHTIGDRDQRQAIEEMKRVLQNVKVGSLYDAVIDYDKNKHEYDSVFDYVRDRLQGKVKKSQRKTLW